MLAVYNSCTLDGIACIIYLHSVYVYVECVYLSSGAYYGPTVATVKVIVAENHRDSMVINTGDAIISRMKPLRKSHLSRVCGRFTSVWLRFGEWLMRHTKNSHFSTLFCTFSHTTQYHTPSSGAYTHSSPPQPISISHFSAHTDQLYIYVYTIVSQSCRRP